MRFVGRLWIAVAIALLGLTFAESMDVTCIPTEWTTQSNAQNLLYTAEEPSIDGLMPSIGNGYVATVLGSTEIYIGGIFNGRNSTGPSHRAIVPSTINVNITNSVTCGVALDIQRALFMRRGLILSSTNETVGVYQQTWYAPLTHRHLLIMTIEAQASNSEDIVLELVSNSGPPSPDIGFMSVPSQTCQLQVGTIFESEIPDGLTPTVAVCTTAIPSSLTVPAGETRNFTFISAFYTSLESMDPAKEVQKEYREAEVQPPLEILNEHTAAWTKRWLPGISVEGDPVLAAAVNTSLYYILVNLREDWPFGLSPGGLSTDVYRGHTFWDMDTWMLPIFIVFHPELARSMFLYRYNRMGEAALAAMAAGLKGLWFPWESAFTGVECCPYYDPEGEYEIHICADISLAIQQYWRATNDVDWLARIGAPMALGIADFWASRVQFNETLQQYVILNVQPPDESAGVVNNSAYTNAAASFALAFGSYVAELLGIDAPIDTWMEIANHTYIPFDKELQIYLEYDGYSGAMINQDDVGLITYPLRWPTNVPTEVAVNNLFYYTNRTQPNGYFTGDSAYSIAWLELGYIDMADAQFNKSYLHILPPFNVWQERVQGGNLNFITGAGGFLQNIVFGYFGLRLNEGYVELNPQLPPGGAIELTLRYVRYLDYAMHVTVNKYGTMLQLAEPHVTGALYVTDAGGQSFPLTTKPLAMPPGLLKLSAKN